MMQLKISEKDTKTGFSVEFYSDFSQLKYVFAEVISASTGDNKNGVILDVRDYGTINANNVTTFKSNQKRINTYKN